MAAVTIPWAQLNGSTRRDCTDKKDSCSLLRPVDDRMRANVSVYANLFVDNFYYIPNCRGLADCNGGRVIHDRSVY
jgi:hypothetical protein